MIILRRIVAMVYAALLVLAATAIRFRMDADSTAGLLCQSRSLKRAVTPRKWKYAHSMRGGGHALGRYKN